MSKLFFFLENFDPENNIKYTTSPEYYCSKAKQEMFRKEFQIWQGLFTGQPLIPEAF